MKDIIDYINEKANFLIKKHIQKSHVYKDPELETEDDFYNCDIIDLLVYIFISKHIWIEPTFGTDKECVACALSNTQKPVQETLDLYRESRLSHNEICRPYTKSEYDTAIDVYQNLGYRIGKQKEDEYIYIYTVPNAKLEIISRYGSGANEAIYDNVLDEVKKSYNKNTSVVDAYIITDLFPTKYGSEYSWWGWSIFDSKTLTHPEKDIQGNKVRYIKIRTTNGTDWKIYNNKTKDFEKFDINELNT